MSEVQYTTVKKIARHIKQMKEDGRSTILLLGAGVSASAGVPLAGQMIDELKTTNKYSYRFDDIEVGENESEYNILMKALTTTQRKDYIRSYIDKAKINLSHLYIGTLVKEGYVDSILTTNFDPLLVKTMSLFNQHCYIYDLANARNYVSDSIMFPNTFYLHGQGHAFLMLNTETELEEPRAYFKTLINDMMKDHCFLVVGYSGLCDFIFQELCVPKNFSNDLYWVGFKNDEPAKHIKQILCSKESVKYINSNGSDAFLRELVNELKVTKMSFIDTPFEHLKEVLQNIGKLKYDNGKEEQSFDLLKQPLTKIETAIDLVEKGKAEDYILELEKVKKGKLNAEILSLALQDDYKKILGQEKEIKLLNTKDAIGALAWALNRKGIEISQKAEEEENHSLYNESIKYYEKATKIKTDIDDAWCNWGNDLAKLADLKGDEKLFRQAFVKYEKATKINSNNYSAWYNWGTDLGNYAVWKNNNKLIYENAFKKFQIAVQKNPEFSPAWYNWGVTIGRYCIALGIHDEKICEEVFKKIEKSIEIDSNRYDSWYSWGFYLCELITTEKSRQPTLKEACKKFEKAAELNKSYGSVWIKWGSTLLELYKLTTEKSYLLESINRFEKGKEFSKDMYTYDLACAYALNGEEEKAIKNLETNFINNEETDRKHIESDEDLISIKDLPKFKELLDKYLPLEKA